MLSGFYAAGSGMAVQSIALNHMTDNITNALVPGYKKQQVLFHSFDQDLFNEVIKMNPLAKSDLATGIDIIQGNTDFSQGPLKHTGDNGDIALEGEGFFQVETTHGIFYTRNGSLRLNKHNELVTKEGYKLLTANEEAIVLDSNLISAGAKFGIEEGGNVYVMDDSKNPSVKVPSGKIGIFKFVHPEKLERMGYGLWKNQNDVAEIKESDAKVHQGYLEMSNISPIEGMVELMVNQRLFDSNANALKELHRNLNEYIKSIIS